MKGKDLKSQIETITLKDGKVYKIEYTLNALIEIEELFGDITEVYTLFENFNLKKLRGLLYAGMVEHQPALTVREAGSLLDMSKLSETVEILSKAFTKAFPDATETEEATQKK